MDGPPATALRFPDPKRRLGAPWIQGQASGGSWKNVNSVPGMAYGTQTGNGGYDDSTAVLSGTWASDQTAQATVVVGSRLSNIAEVELASCVPRFHPDGSLDMNSISR